MKHHLSLFVLVSATLLACTEYKLEEDGDRDDGLEEEGVPDIQVNPAEVNFGDVKVNDTMEHVEVVTVANVGTADLHIQGIELEDPVTPFQVSAIQSVLIAPQQSTQFEVSYTPETAVESTTYILIDNDDPDTPTAMVAIVGNGLAPVISIDPSEYDFGTLYVGCENVLPVTISNIGNDTLVLSSFSYNTGSTDIQFGGVDPAYDSLVAMDGTISLAAPGSLDPSSVVVNVNYRPIDDYADVAYLYVTSNDPYTPEALAQQTGNGAIYGTQTDIFEQPVKGMTDIVFALDRSGSMATDLAQVAANFDVYVNTLVGLDADFHVAATVNDDGCIVGSEVYIDNSFSASDAEATISVMEDISGAYGANTERAFMLLEACLSSDNLDPGGCNEGLVREDARLNLIGVSDEREQSVNSWSYYVTLFQSMKDDPDDVVMHAVGGDYPSGCGDAEPYANFYEATVATGGVFLSICATDWGSHLELLAEGSTADRKSVV